MELPLARPTGKRRDVLSGLANHTRRVRTGLWAAVMNEPKRTFEVKVFDLCPECSVLRSDVEKREHRSYYPMYSVSLKSCSGCFEIAKKKAAAEAYSGSVFC